jgi:hypothetical protein
VVEGTLLEDFFAPAADGSHPAVSQTAFSAATLRDALQSVVDARLS